MCDCDCRRVPAMARLGTEHETIQKVADAAVAAAHRGGDGLP